MEGQGRRRSATGAWVGTAARRRRERANRGQWLGISRELLPARPRSELACPASGTRRAAFGTWGRGSRSATLQPAPDPARHPQPIVEQTFTAVAGGGRVRRGPIASSLCSAPPTHPLPLCALAVVPIARERDAEDQEECQQLERGPHGGGWGGVVAEGGWTMSWGHWRNPIGCAGTGRRQLEEAECGRSWERTPHE